MKKIIYLFILVSMMMTFNTCRKETIPNRNLFNYYLYELSIVPDSARIYDTVLIKYNTNKEVPDSVRKYFKVFMEDSVVKIIDFPDKKSLRVQIPNLFQLLDYPRETKMKITVKLLIQQDYITADNFFVYVKPEILKVSPLSGKAGDTITIFYKDLNWLKQPKFIINTLPCQIVDSTALYVKVLVPKGCGNGHVLICDYDSRNYNPDLYNYSLRFEGPFFRYNFLYAHKKQYAKKFIVEETAYYSIMRDSINRISRRNILGTDMYEIFIYGKNGLLDSLLVYRADTLYEYYTYKGDTNLLRIEEKYNYKGIKIRIQEFYYSMGRLTRITNYLANESGSLYKERQSDYAYNGNKGDITVRLYEKSGNFKQSYTCFRMYDLYNNTFDIYAPGFPSEYPYNLTTKEWGNLMYIYYNEFGNVYKIDKLAFATFYRSFYVIEYAE